jgi:hypothetical protein
VGATDAERVGPVGATDAERLSPRRASGETILGRYDDEVVVGDATRELGGETEDRDVFDKPV